MSARVWSVEQMIMKLYPVTESGILISTCNAGNKPPWSLPAKAAYGQFDRVRAGKYFGVEDFKIPPFFPPLTILVRFLRI